MTAGENQRIKPLTSIETMRAGDGNRNRMTSLEGFECGGAEQHVRRSGNTFTCPSVTVNLLDSLPRRARNGHARRKIA